MLKIVQDIEVIQAYSQICIFLKILTLMSGWYMRETREDLIPHVLQLNEKVK